MRLVSGVFVLIILPILLVLFVEWCPWFAERLIRLATRRLPEHARARYKEEWLAEFEALKGDGRRLSTFVLAMWVFLRARGMGRILSGVPPVTQVLLERIRLWVMLRRGQIPLGMARLEWTQVWKLGPFQLKVRHRAFAKISRMGKGTLDLSNLSKRSMRRVERISATWPVDRSPRD